MGTIMSKYSMNPRNYNMGQNELHDVRIMYSSRTRREKTKDSQYKAGSHIQNAIGLSVSGPGLLMIDSEKDPYVCVQVCNRSKGLSGMINIPMDAVPALAAALLLAAEGTPEFTHHPFIRKARLELEAAINDIKNLNAIGVK